MKATPWRCCSSTFTAVDGWARHLEFVALHSSALAPCWTRSLRPSLWRNTAYPLRLRASTIATAGHRHRRLQTGKCCIWVCRVNNYHFFFDVTTSRIHQRRVQFVIARWRSVNRIHFSSGNCPSNFALRLHCGALTYGF